jgi:hypothetical protein
MRLFTQLVLLPESELGEEDGYPRYFVPNADGDVSVRSMGQYANDLAYQPGMGDAPGGEHAYRCVTRR